MDLQDWLDAIAQSLSPDQRKALMQKIAQGLRVRTRQRIAAQRDPNGQQFIPRKREQVGRIRRGAMFAKLPKKLKTEYSADHAAVGFKGRDAQVARVHQLGLSDRPNRRQNPIRYPIRELLGFSDDDRAWVAQQIQKFIGNSS